MIWCNINLARNLILPKKQRRIIYLGMITYLIFAGILFILMIIDAALGIQEGMRCRQQTQLIQANFNDNYPRKDSIPDYAEQIEKTLINSENLAASINKNLPDKIQTSLPLITALIQPSEDRKLYDLKFFQQLKNGTPAMEFSIQVSAADRNVPDLAQLWQNNKELIRQFKSITPVTTRRGRIGTGDVFIMSYEAEFRE